MIYCVDCTRLSRRKVGVMSDSVAKDIVARDLMISDYPRIQETEALGEAIRRLVELSADPALPNVLIVVDEGGRYEGVLTARLLFRCLLGHWMPSQAAHADMKQLYDDLLSAAAAQEQSKIGEALIRGLPKAKPSTLR